MESYLGTQNKTQLDRFKEAARELGTDESDVALDEIMSELDLKKKPEAGEKKDD